MSNEHNERDAARARLVEREQRFTTYVEGQGGSLSDLVTAEEARKEIEESQLCLKANAVEFVQAYR